MPRIAVYFITLLFAVLWSFSTYFLVAELSDYRYIILPYLSTFALGALLIFSILFDEEEERKMKRH